MKRDKDRSDDQRLYLGVDVGGTKVQASLVQESGEIIGREKCPTPRKGGEVLSGRSVGAIRGAIDAGGRNMVSVMPSGRNIFRRA